MSEFTNEDIKEAKLKAFELFALCMEQGPCNDCPFYIKDNKFGEATCLIGCPNTWKMFSVHKEETRNNRKAVLEVLKKRKKEEK